MQNGDIPITRQLSVEELKTALFHKAQEELLEVQKDFCIEEIADVYEVLLGLASILRVTPDQLHEVADLKREARGGFEQGVWLEKTISNEEV